MSAEKEILEKKCLIQGVVHKVFFKGGVQSLAFDDSRGNNSVGVVLPGKWDFGILDAPETIKVLSGQIEINGFMYPTPQGHNSCPLKKGDKIIFRTDRISSYLCIKG